MVRRTAVGITLLIGILLVTGCSFSVDKYNPFKKKAVSVTDKVYDKKTLPARDREEVMAEIDIMVATVVEHLKAGRWNDAVIVGDKAFSLAQDPVFSQNVSGSVYAVTAMKEKVDETLSSAYDYKAHLEGLNQEEKTKYVQVARDHAGLNTAEPLKKLALAKVLVDTGNYAEGLKLAGEVYNSGDKSPEITNTYAWALYKAGKKNEAYNIYKTFYSQAQTLLQLYRSAVVIEEQDKPLGLLLYRGCLKYGNNLMVAEPNIANQSTQSYINRVMTDSQKAIDRLLAGGFGVDSQYKMDVKFYIPPIVIWK